MKMNGARILLEMLRLHEIRHVFGLPGETTLGLYREWLDFPDISHILTHDERAAAFMAEAYAKVTGKVGVSEAPSPGAGHPVPGVVESFTGSVPTLCLTSDVPYNSDKRNTLSGFDQNSLYSSITKESMLVTRAKDIPFLIRRAFRVAVSGRPGAVHIRIPMDVYEEETEVCDLYPDPCLARWPYQRPVADANETEKAIDLLSKAKRPVIVCGQGALVSDAGNEVLELAETLRIPVACTMTGKGTVPETHPLSIRVIGARGGTSYTNQFLRSADLVFFVGSNNDSAGTDGGKLPPCVGGPRIISLNIDGVDAANCYPTDAVLVGDAKATLRHISGEIRSRGMAARTENAGEVASAMTELDRFAKEQSSSLSFPVNPIRFVKELEARLPDNSYIIVEPSVASIFSAAYLVQKKKGRLFVSNYTNGALGYSLPAAVGVAVAHPESTVFAMGGDGSFHFNCGELETYSRLGLNIKMLLFRNDVFGWIKGETKHVYHSGYFATDFRRVDYTGVAEAFGVRAFRVEGPGDIAPALKNAIDIKGPVLIELPVPDETELVPPVPRWIKSAEEDGTPCCY